MRNLLIAAVAALIVSASAVAQIPGLPKVPKVPGGDSAPAAAAQTVPWPAELLIPKPDEGDYAKTPRYSAVVVGKVCYVVDRLDSISTRQDQLAADAALFLVALAGTDADKAKLADMQKEIDKAANPDERNRATIARNRSATDLAAKLPVKAQKLDAEKQKILVQQSQNAAVADGLNRQKAIVATYGIALAAAETKNAKSAVKNPVEVVKAVSDLGDLSQKLDQNKKATEVAKDQLQKMNASFAELRKANDVPVPDQKVVDAEVKAGSSQKLTGGKE